MAEPLNLIVWTPSETLLEVEHVEWVHVELVGHRGLTVWPGHLPVLGETVPAALSYGDQAGSHAVELPSGIVEVRENRVTVFLAGTIDEQASQTTELPRLHRLAEGIIPSVAPEQRSRDEMP